MGEVTELIASARQGDRASLDRIFEFLYPELRRAAHRRLARNTRDGGLNTTALVNECYMKFAERDGLTPADRPHFLAYAASVMRSVIVDAARAANSERRGGDMEQVTLNTGHGETIAQAADEILDVHGALDELHAIDARLVRIVEMRYFVGMTDLEIGAALGLTDRTVRRDWQKARLMLAQALRH